MNKFSKQYFVFLLVVLFQVSVVESRGDVLETLRTSKKIMPVSSLTAPYFAIQILALKLPPTNPAFFSNVELAYEYNCNDGFVRYTVGPYESYALAKADIERVRALGFEDPFVVDVRKYDLKEDYSSAFRFDEKGKLPPDPKGIYTIQLAAFRYPVYVSHFAEFENVMEFYFKDEIYRYCVGKYSGDKALENLARVRAMGYPQAYLVLLENYLPFQIE